MTRYSKDAQGHYHIHGHKYEMLEGSRAQVLHGTAYKTSGGLKKHDLLQNKHGRIVSRKKHGTAKKEKRLIKAGYGTKKGQFGAVKLSKGKSKKMRGGYSNGSNLSPAPINEAAAGVGSHEYSGIPISAPQYAGAYRSKSKSRSRSRYGGDSSVTSLVNNLGKTITKAVPLPNNLMK